MHNHKPVGPSVRIPKKCPEGRHRHIAPALQWGPIYCTEIVHVYSTHQFEVEAEEGRKYTFPLAWNASGKDGFTGAFQRILKTKN